MAHFVVQFARDGPALGFLDIHQAGGKLLQFMAAVGQLTVPAAGLPLQPHDVRHARHGQQQAGSERDGQRFREAGLQTAELRQERFIGAAKLLIIPRLELAGRFEELGPHGDDLPVDERLLATLERLRR